MEVFALQDKFATRMASLVESPWDEICVHYENAEIDGISREIFTSSVLIDGAKRELRIPLDAIDTLAQLQQQPPQGQKDKWVWLDFVVDKHGKYKFDFKYENPPLIMKQARYSR